jgi:hypothetical protein
VYRRTVPDARIDKIFPDSTTNRAETALSEMIDRGQQHIQQLLAKGRNSNKNAQKTHIFYWLELTRLWQAIAPENTPNKHYHLSEFLFACSQSLFPDKTYETITAFIERYFPQMSV